MRILLTTVLSLVPACGGAPTGDKKSASAGDRAQHVEDGTEGDGTRAEKAREKGKSNGQNAGDSTPGGEAQQLGYDKSDGSDGAASHDDAGGPDSKGGATGDTAEADGRDDADGNELAGKRYFEDTILPLFTAACASCHVDPRKNPPQRGPLTIFSFEKMQTMLEDGTSATDNRLSRKVRNADKHGGGNRCSDGPTASPCKEIMEWRRLALGADSGLDARINTVSVTGDVFGYAVDTRDETKTVTVRLFVDGNLSVETPASADGADGNYAGRHAFKAVLPAAVRDGKEHTLQIYVGDVPVGSAFKFTAYAPKDAARAYFTSTVAPALNGRCRGCHVVQYEVQYGALLSPAPHKGGTAADNVLVNYAAGGSGHPGGNVCGSKTGSPCNLFQTWWSMEFGP